MGNAGVLTGMARIAVLAVGAPIIAWTLFTSLSTTRDWSSRPAKRLEQSRSPPPADFQFDGGGKFKIGIFSDLHYGEEESGWGIDQDVNSTRVMRNILDYEDPDFVVINGDLITGENTFSENSTGYFHQVVAPLIEHNTPWGSTYGNHDSKFNLSREALFAVESTYSLSHTQQMDESLPGITNYYLLLYARSGSYSAPKPAAVLWFFDSRGGASYQHEPANEDDIPNWVHPDVVGWFRKTSGQLKAAHGVLKSLVFVHIPPRVFATAQETDLDPTLFPGVNDDKPLAYQGEGDDLFNQALLDVEGLHSVHVSHDHGNAWCSTVSQVPLSGFHENGSL
jgi:hypothetical protein